MNQSILFNDDLCFDHSLNAWKFTGLQSGNLITVLIDEVYFNRNREMTNCTKFDWEEAVEIWLESNEPEENGQIKLTF